MTIKKIKVRYRPNPFKIKWQLQGFRVMNDIVGKVLEGNIRVRQVIAQNIEPGVPEGYYFVHSMFPKNLMMKQGDSIELLPKFPKGKEYF